MLRQSIRFGYGKVRVKRVLIEYLFTVPSIPRNVVVVANEHSIQLAWSPPYYTGSQEINGYAIQVNIHDWHTLQEVSCVEEYLLLCSNCIHPLQVYLYI